MHSDNAKESSQGEWRKVCNDFSIKTTFTVPHSPWQNHAKGHIREAKHHIHRKMKAKNVPKRLWPFCSKWSCDVRNKTASNSFFLNGRTPYEAIYGQTPNISSICEFNLYELIWYYEPHDFPADKRLIGGWLREAQDIGQAMSYWILPASRIPIVRSTVQVLDEADKSDEAVKVELVAFDQAITSKLVTEAKIQDANLDVNSSTYPTYQEEPWDDCETPQFEPVEEEASMPHADEFTPEKFDKYIAAEVMLPRGDNMVIGKIIRRKHDIDGNPIGVAHLNLIFDTRIYQVQFPE